MTNDGNTKNRDSISTLLDDLEKDASEVEQMGRDLTGSARLARDVVGSFRKIVDNTPNDDMLPEEHWKRAHDAFEAVRSAAKPVLQNKPQFEKFAITVSGSTATTVSSIYVIGPIPPPLEPMFKSAKAELEQTIAGLPLMKDVCAAMRRLGLHVRPNKRSALQLLEDAKVALDQPQSSAADGPLPPLLSLREAILTALTELLPRRPIQEPASKDQGKVVSIGKQCGRTDLSADHFDRLGSDCHELIDRLSGKKQASMPRPEIVKLFNEGLLFLKAFTDSIDESRFRSA